MRGAALTIGLVFAASVAAAQTPRVVAVEGQRLAGTARKISYLHFPTVGPAGEVAVAGYLEDDVAGSVFELRGEKLRIAVRGGRRAAGLPRGYVHGYPQTVGYDALGQLYFIDGSAHPATGNGESIVGVWRKPSGRSRAELVYRAGEVDPDVGTLEVPGLIALGAAGHTAFAAGNRIVVRSPAGAFTVAVSEDTTPTGVPEGAAFTGFGRFALDASGALAFEGYVYDAVADTGGAGVWRRRATGELEALAAPGASPPEAGGLTIQGASLGRMGASGRVAMTGGFVEMAERWCVFEAEAAASLPLAVQCPETLPGVSTDCPLAYIDRAWIDDAGRGLYRIGLSSSGAGCDLPGWDGVWESASGTFLPIILPGGEVAEPAEHTIDAPRGVYLGRAGTILFEASLAEDAIPYWRRSLFAIPAAGGPPVRLLTDGDWLDLPAHRWMRMTYQLPMYTQAYDQGLSPVDLDRVALRMRGWNEGVPVAIVVFDVPSEAD